MNAQSRRSWSRRWALLGLLAVLPLPGPAAAADVAVGDTIKGSVSRVASGKSLEIGGRSITLWGIAVPKPGQRCVSAERVDYDCGELVRFELQLLTAKTPLTCLVKDIDQRDTIQAQCDREGADLGSLLVVGGYAFDDVWRSAGWYAEYADIAFANRAGLWTGEFTVEKGQPEVGAP